MTTEPTDNKIIKFTNCYLLRNHKIVKDDLWCRKGKILNPEIIFFCEKTVADEVVDCGGCLIAPGFIDLQINGGYGVDFSSETEKVNEGVDKVAKCILAHGVIAFCPTLISCLPDVYKKILPSLTKRAGGPSGAAVLGVHLEGPFLNAEKHGSHETKFLAELTEGYKTITDIYGPALNNVCMVTLAPELPNALDVIEKLVLRRFVVSLGHSSASFHQAIDAVERGASCITHLFNAMGQFHHRDPGLVGLIASEKASKIWYGIICDGDHTHPASIRLAYRAHPEGCVVVTDATPAMGLPDGTHNLGSKVVDVKNGKAYITKTDMLCGSIKSFIDCVKIMKEASGCSLVDALEAGSLRPAQVLKLEKQKGTLNYNADADFIMLNDGLQVLETWIAARRVYRAENITTRTFTFMNKKESKVVVEILTGTVSGRSSKLIS